MIIVANKNDNMTQLYLHNNMNNRQQSINEKSFNCSQLRSIGCYLNFYLNLLLEDIE